MYNALKQHIRKCDNNDCNCFRCNNKNFVDRGFASFGTKFPAHPRLLQATGATVADDEDVDSGGVEQLNLNFFWLLRSLTCDRDQTSRLNTYHKCLQLLWPCWPYMWSRLPNTVSGACKPWTAVETWCQIWLWRAPRSCCCCTLWDAFIQSGQCHTTDGWRLLVCVLAVCVCLNTPMFDQLSDSHLMYLILAYQWGKGWLCYSLFMKVLQWNTN